MTDRLTLDYRLPKGRLAPFFEALARGEALAARCTCCGCVQFPPANACPRCGSAGADWCRLGGDARLLHRTETPDAAFALVRFHGADTAALVRLTDRTARGREGRLVAATEEAPALTLALTAETDEDCHV